MSEEVTKEKDAQEQKVFAEIDYNKLADAIVRAQQRLDAEKSATVAQPEQKKAETDNKKEKYNGWKLFVGLLIGKLPKDKEMQSSSYLSMLSGFILKAFAFVGRFFAILLFVGTIVKCVYSDWAGMQIVENVFDIILAIFFILFLLMFATITKSASKDLEKEQDKNYLASVFSGLVGLGALLVATVALFK